MYKIEEKDWLKYIYDNIDKAEILDEHEGIVRYDKYIIVFHTNQKECPDFSYFNFSINRGSSWEEIREKYSLWSQSNRNPSNSNRQNRLGKYIEEYYINKVLKYQEPPQPDYKNILFAASCYDYITGNNYNENLFPNKPTEPEIQSDLSESEKEILHESAAIIIKEWIVEQTESYTRFKLSKYLGVILSWAAALMFLIMIFIGIKTGVVFSLIVAFGGIVFIIYETKIKPKTTSTKYHVLDGWNIKYIKELEYLKEFFSNYELMKIYDKVYKELTSK